MRINAIPLYPNNYKPSQELKLPQVHKLLDRKALVMRSKKTIGSAPQWIWVDDAGSCKDHHTPNHAPLFHLLYDTQNRQWALRCPNSIPENEQWRVLTDYPEGSIHKRFDDFIAQHGRFRDDNTPESKAKFERFDE